MTHRPSLKEVMVRYNLLPKKSLGQNFLLDENITHKVAAAAGDLKGRRVIEIGPGPGGLTRAILDLGAAEVIAIEMDPTCITALQDLNEDRLTVLHQDALKVNYEALLQHNKPTKIIANLPYNIGTELLFKWLPLIDKIESYTLEREVLLPEFDIPKKFVDEQDKVDGKKRGENSYLKYLTYQGAKERYIEITDAIKEFFN